MAPRDEQEFEAERAAVKRASAKSDASRKSESGPSVLLVSGLGVGGPSQDGLRLQMLLEHVSGETLPDSELLSAGSGANVARMIVAGGGISSLEGDGVPAAIKELDLSLSGFCAALPVDVMPGATDPSNHMMPQAPIHPCLMPISQSFQSLNCTPNPYSARIGGLKFLGTSGQPIQDMRKYSSQPNDETAMQVDGDDEGTQESAAPVPPEEIHALELSLKARHLAPTAPDSLAAFPFTQDDPFVIAAEDCPDVYFCGGASKFATKVLDNGTRLICVPRFEETGEAVRVDLETLEADVICFEC
ncbi:hypothetical protein TeGR_g14858 [Tetraparma gracilis]|uniref:DNA polymerase alpha/delta/epsilon subunit B domain-containing protein n=1 Tax=Tetraparma gracilis TaxID=2962635 RepID=A0ABQ6MR69_9STRA|nr:hypothetical protein TeGR_g14858 [Tetraparma gracilis]